MIYDRNSLCNLMSQVLLFILGTRELIEIIRFSDHVNPFYLERIRNL